MEILFICVVGTIAGCDGPVELEDFVYDHEDWFRRFVRLKNGVPSHDTIGRVISLVKPEQFQQAFLEWVQAMTANESDDEPKHFMNTHEPKCIAIDGKTMRGSGGSREREHPLHLVSAWATKQGLTLGQVAVDSKSNEITAIPRLLQTLEMKGAIISIDAMGCQTEIASIIHDGGADYVLALKDNQPTTREATEEFFLRLHEEQDFAAHGARQKATEQKARGGTETRHYTIAPLPASLQHLAKTWPGLKSLGQAITITTDRHGKVTSEVRYYLSSREAKVGDFANTVRNHWKIESMHWILDVIFNEDKSRLRNNHSPQNFSLLRKFTIGLLQRDTSNLSLRRKRKRAARNTQFLENILFS
jgi:predicted transposase YbfD/YdcC